MLCSCLSDCQGAKRYFKARTFANNVPLIAFQTAQKQPGCRYRLILPFRTFAAEKQQSVQNGSWCLVRIQTQVGNSGAPGGLPPYSGLLESRQNYRVTSLGLLFAYITGFVTLIFLVWDSSFLCKGRGHTDSPQLITTPVICRGAMFLTCKDPSSQITPLWPAFSVILLTPAPIGVTLKCYRKH